MPGSRDAIAASPWSRSETVQGFSQSAPNAALLAFAEAEVRRLGRGEAARVLTPGGSLFVFTFSRHILPPDTDEVLGESFVFTQFSGEPQCFLTEPQLLAELRAGGFVPDRDVPLRELNRPCSGMLTTARTPVIYEAVFRRLEQE